MSRRTGVPLLAQLVSQKTLLVFSSGNSLYIFTYRDGFYQKGSKRGTLIMFPLQLFPLLLPYLSYLCVLVSDRDTELLGGRKMLSACTRLLLAAGWHNPQVLPKAVCDAVPRDRARSKAFLQTVFLKRKRGGGAHPLHHL